MTLKIKNQTQQTAGAVTTVTLDGLYEAVAVRWRGGSEIFFTTDGSTPTVEGDNCYCAPAGVGPAVRAVVPSADSNGSTVVKFIGVSAYAFNVEGLSEGPEGLS